MPTYDRFEGALPRYRDSDVLAAFMRGVYGWMCGGLATTAATAWFVSSSRALVAAIFGNRLLFWILIIAQLGIVFTLSARVDRMAAGIASLLFAAYSALTGVTLSSILLSSPASRCLRRLSSRPACSAHWRRMEPSRAES
jgi:hypothetical protein